MADISLQAVNLSLASTSTSSTGGRTLEEGNFKERSVGQESVVSRVTVFAGRQFSRCFVAAAFCLAEFLHDVSNKDLVNRCVEDRESALAADRVITFPNCKADAAENDLASIAAFVALALTSFAVALDASSGRKVEGAKNDANRYFGIADLFMSGLYELGSIACFVYQEMLRDQLQESLATTCQESARQCEDPKIGMPTFVLIASLFLQILAVRDFFIFRSQGS